MKSRLRLYQLVLAVLVSAGLWMSVGGAVLKPERLPKAARDAVAKMIPGGEIQEVELERRITQLYSVGVMVDGHEREVSVTADGVVLETEEEIEADEAPDAIKESLQKLAPDGNLVEVERIVVYAALKPVPLKEPRTEYEAEVRVQNKDRAVRLSEEDEPVANAVQPSSQSNEDEND